ncbi:TolC family protein [Nitratifractor sp.]
MKASSALKKSSLLCSLALSLLQAEGTLENYLSREKNLLFDYRQEINRLDSAILRKSWISPVMLSYSESTSTQPWGEDAKDRTFSVGIDQPIFKSGGIYYAIKFADVLEGANRTEIKLQRRQLIVQAVQTLFELKKTRYKKRQLELLIRNDNIDIRRKKEQYESGVIDSSFLNQAILQRNRDRTNLLVMELTERNLLNAFSLLSDKDPKRLRLPKLTLIDRKSYREENLELEAQRLRVEQSDYNSKMTWSKYLPTLSLNANYYNTDSNRPLIGMDDSYYRYGFRISMPININAPQDIEARRVEYLRAAVQLQDDSRRIDNEYRHVLDTIRIIEKKIALARADEKLYRSLLKSTKEQAAVGEKTRLDVETMRNSMEIARLDAKVYEIEKQIQLLQLYAKTRR